MINKKAIPFLTSLSHFLDGWQLPTPSHASPLPPFPMLPPSPSIPGPPSLYTVSSNSQRNTRSDIVIQLANTEVNTRSLARTWGEAQVERAGVGVGGVGEGWWWQVIRVGGGDGGGGRGGGGETQDNSKERMWERRKRRNIQGRGVVSEVKRTKKRWRKKEKREPGGRWPWEWELR